MIEYLINVVLIAAPYWMLALVFFVIGFAVRKKIGVFWSGFKSVSLLFLVFGLFSGLTSSSNTYKNTVDYDPVQEQRLIEQAREFQPTTEIVDRTRQPLTQEDRAATAIDMRDRVTID